MSSRNDTSTVLKGEERKCYCFENEDNSRISTST